MNNLLFIGTTSNAGKSFITGFAGKILKEDYNLNVAPFKGQNMSNYATVCEYDRELAIAQSAQAELMGVTPLADMCPVLLKVLGDCKSQIIVRGMPKKITTAWTYYSDMDELFKEVDAAYNNLNSKYEKLIMEGAGSGFELNLQKKDLANTHMMEKEDVDIVLVTNIENGGVFASILGSYQLMPDDIKQRFKGVIINNFRGDTRLFNDGVKIIEEWGIPVLGVVPHVDYGLDCEDGLSYMGSFIEKHSEVTSVGVVMYPKASNIADIEPLMHDPNVQVTFIYQRTNLDSFDKIILPGSRAVMDGLRWMKKTGIFNDLKTTNAEIYGICGGYQMLHALLKDPHGTESGGGEDAIEEGLGFINGSIKFKEHKVLKRQNYTLYEGINVHGFEMHTGVSDTNPLFFESKQVKGSMVHEIFHDDDFRKWWLKSHNYKDWGFLKWKKAHQDKVADVLRKTVKWEQML